MKPLKIRIRKKEKVPTRRQRNHRYRSDWKCKLVLDYKDTYKLFNCFGFGPIKTDAQFCKLLYQELGPGIYHILAWSKGYEGFWSFGMYELRSDGFVRIKKEKTAERKEREENKREIRKLKKEIAETKDIEKANNLKEELADTKEFQDLLVEIDEESNSHKRRGPTPYLKQKQPVYDFHEYEDINSNTEKEVSSSGLW
jgi:hypothetical protein